MKDAPRLDQLDGLRAVAALLVLGYHYTTRYDATLVHSSPLPVDLPLGHFGVELFFVISGFVIMMTLDRSRSPADFAVSRFSRLYPTYWFAVLVTGVAMRAVGMPGYERPVRDIAANLTMVQGWFGVESIDGAYWSLGVELVFYLWMLLLWRAGALERVGTTVAAILAASLCAHLAPALGVPVPHVLRTLVLAEWAPWFALGMTLYAYRERRLAAGATALLVALALVAVAAAAPAGGWRTDVAVGVVAAAAVHLAAGGRLAPLGARPLVALGLASYPLYLLHQALGFLAIAALQRAGVPSLASVIAVTVAAIAVAFAVHRCVERPATAAIRAAWLTRRGAPGRGASAWSTGAAAALLVLATGNTLVGRLFGQTPGPHEPIRAVDAVRQPAVPCVAPDGASPRVLLVLGQSNAASHAAPLGPQASDGPVVTVFAEGRCVRSADPLPGTTGAGASLWTAVEAEWRAAGRNGPVVWAPLAVGATGIARWTTAGDPVNARLLAHLEALRRSGLHVERVLWQQGESDSRDGTDADDWLAALRTLRATLDAHGIDAPMHVARSTWCRTGGTGALARALDRHRDALAAARILPGADTDTLQGPGLRRDGCHFTEAGRVEAARLWVRVLAVAAR
ncbi:MAG: hypothetical protein RJA99_538 [Pseudomonadota bacterium]|jgi:peptidoglycan/LPS O-acetylase OafA/YrhL